MWIYLKVSKGDPHHLQLKYHFLQIGFATSTPGLVYTNRGQVSKDTLGLWGFAEHR
jgi:hypothetical protein